MMTHLIQQQGPAHRKAKDPRLQLLTSKHTHIQLSWNTIKLDPNKNVETEKTKKRRLDDQLLCWSSGLGDHFLLNLGSFRWFIYFPTFSPELLKKFSRWTLNSPPTPLFFAVKKPGSVHQSSSLGPSYSCKSRVVDLLPQWWTATSKCSCLSTHLVNIQRVPQNKMKQPKARHLPRDPISAIWFWLPPRPGSYPKVQKRFPLDGPIEGSPCPCSPSPTSRPFLTSLLHHSCKEVVPWGGRSPVLDSLWVISPSQKKQSTTNHTVWLATSDFRNWEPKRNNQQKHHVFLSTLWKQRRSRD